MKIIKPFFRILTSQEEMSNLEIIEYAGRICYKSKVKEEGRENFIRGRIKEKHESIIEHKSASVLFVCDRGISHEIVRHRLASFSQESTRYCNYSLEKFDKQITFIEPMFYTVGSPMYDLWENSCRCAEEAYFNLLQLGSKPQEARSVLPNSLKTEIVVTFNYREWRHFFNLRAAGKAGNPHPQMLQLTVPLLRKFQEIVPAVFEDITPMEVPNYV